MRAPVPLGMCLCYIYPGFSFCRAFCRQGAPLPSPSLPLPALLQISESARTQPGSDSDWYTRHTWEHAREEEPEYRMC